MGVPSADGSHLVVVRDYDALSRAAADIVAETVAADPEADLAVPTGSTPAGLFAELAARVREGRLDLSRAHVWCLDEYLGVPEDDPDSLTGWLRRIFFGPAGIAPGRIHPVPATAPDPDRAGPGFEADLAARGGLDLAVLGLGANGHVAYNEPGSAADSRTRLLALSPESVAQAAAGWTGSTPPPAHAVTMGVGTLLEASRLVLIVSGAAKAAILRRTLHEPVTAEVPASWLRLAGERLTVIADVAAAAGLGDVPDPAGR